MPDAAGDRYPKLGADELTEEQAAVVREIADGPRGGFGGPFVPLLRSPQLARRIQAVGEQIRYHSLIEHRLVEFAVLLVARRWTQRFEWGVHVPLALAAGIDQETVEAVAREERPAGMDPALAAAYDLFRELTTTAAVSDRTFHAAHDALGEVAVIELVSVFGYYTTLAMVMNTAQTRAPRTLPPVALPERPPGGSAG